MTAPRWLPLAVAVAAFLAVTQYWKKPHAEPVICERDVAAAAADVVMLGASWCRYCRAARSYLVAAGINYCEFDIEQSSRGAELYAASGVGVIPVVYIGEDLIVGFDRDELTEVLLAHDLLRLDHR
jgi:glutaredoxin